MKNEYGQRVLDTLVKADDPNLQIGAKNKVVKEFSEKRAPTLQQVQDHLRVLIKGRVLVGYHIEMKLDDLGLLEENEYAMFHDCSKMFNENPMSGQQWQLRTLCKEFLNLTFKKPATTYAVRKNDQVIIE